MDKLIIANWKMNGSNSSIRAFVNKLNEIQIGPNIVLCLPYPYLYIGANKNFVLGAQDCHKEKQGSYTGGVSAEMLYDMGCKYVILGHSEMRKYHSEKNHMIKEKALSAINSGLIPIICVGEEKQNSDIEKILQQSMDSLCEDCIVAYEPIWAIGTGITPSIEKIYEITNFLKEMCDVPVLYGGSINHTNAKKILKISSVSGLLVGKSSLNFDTFTHIINAALD